MDSMSKPGLIVHAGMPKTGTRSIQTTLGSSDWADVLAHRGIRYICPDGLAVNHGRYLNAIVDRPTWVPELERAALAERFCTALHGVSQSLPPGWVGLVSAEALFDLARHMPLLSRVAMILRRHFEVVSVPVYVREPMSYATSRVQQALKAAYPLQECLRSAEHQCDMMASIRNLEAVFGADVVRVRSYDRALLDGGDVLRDFALHMLGLERTASLDERIRLTPSSNFGLPREILEPLLDIYARKGVTPRNVKGPFIQRLNVVRWKGAPFSLADAPTELLEPIVEAADRARAALRAWLKYDCFPSFRPDAHERRETSPESSFVASAENIGILKALIGEMRETGEDSVDLPTPDTAEQARQQTLHLLERLYALC